MIVDKEELSDTCTHDDRSVTQEEADILYNTYVEVYKMKESNFRRRLSFVVSDEDRKICESVKTLLKTNASYLLLNQVRESIAKEKNIKKMETMEELDQLVRKLSCCPNGFNRVVYCGVCTKWYYTTSVICPVCRHNHQLTILFKGCDTDSCFAKQPELRPFDLDSDTVYQCTHHRRTSQYGNPLIKLTLTIVGDLVGNGRIDDLVDVLRSEIQKKIAYCTETGQLCVACGLNSLQNYIALGEKDLARSLKKRYENMRTPTECRGVLYNGLKRMKEMESIEMLIFLKKATLTPEQLLQYMTHYQEILRSASAKEKSRSRKSEGDISLRW